MAWYESHRITPPWWLRQGKVVASCRARFVRNIEGRKFPVRMNNIERESILNEIKLSIEDRVAGFKSVSINSEFKRNFFIERHILNPESNEGSFIYTSHSEEETYIINDRDHIRFQFTMPKNTLSDVLSIARDRIRMLEKEFNFSYTEKFGYLTSSLTNTGTGFRLSSLLFLPGIFLARDTEKILPLLVKTPIILRGLFGGRSEIKGNYLEIATKFTLGMSVEESFNALNEVINTIVDIEKKSRDMLLANAKLELEDRVARSLAILESAMIISYDESLEHLSILKFAAQVGFEGVPNEENINRMILWSSPVHLMSLYNFEVKDEEEIDVKRAEFLKEHLWDGYEN